MALHHTVRRVRRVGRDDPALLDPAAAWRSRDLVRSEEALAYEPGDPSVLVAVCDTGVATGHPELAGRLRQAWTRVQLGTGILSGGLALLGDTSGIDLDPDDEVGHGTSCSAIIGAAGLDLPPGAAGACALMPVRVLGSAAYRHGKRMGVGALSDIDCGVKRAVDLGAKVLNLSFGVPEGAVGADGPLPHVDVIRYALSRGCVLVAAASGNSGEVERYIPAAIDGVIAVGAVTDDGFPTRFTTRGPHVAVCAPGERIVSAALGGQAMVTGTSFAAPFVTAAAALLVSRAARRAIPLDSTTVRDLLAASTSPFAPAQATDGCGTGVLDIAAALQNLDQSIDSGDGRAPPDFQSARIPSPVPSLLPQTQHHRDPEEENDMITTAKVTFSDVKARQEIGEARLTQVIAELEKIKKAGDPSVSDRLKELRSLKTTDRFDPILYAVRKDVSPTSTPVVEDGRILDKGTGRNIKSPEELEILAVVGLLNANGVRIEDPERGLHLAEDVRFRRALANARAEFRSQPKLFENVYDALAEESTITDKSGKKTASVKAVDVARVSRALSERGIAATDGYLPIYAKAVFNDVAGQDDDAAPSTIDIDLPALESDVDVEIVKSNLDAMQAIYFAATLEDLKLFQTMDKLVELFHQGMLPLGKGAAGNQLYTYWKKSTDRLTEVERRNLYARAFGFPGGDASTGSPNREFTDLWYRFASGVSEYTRQNTLEKLLRSPVPSGVSAELVRKSGRDLAANLSLYGYGVAYFAATEMQAQIRDIMRVLGDEEILSAYGARDLWQVVDQVATLELGGARNGVRQRTMATSGATIIRWLRLNVDKLSSIGQGLFLDPKPNPYNPTHKPMVNPDRPGPHRRLRAMARCDGNVGATGRGVLTTLGGSEHDLTANPDPVGRERPARCRRRDPHAVQSATNAASRKEAIAMPDVPCPRSSRSGYAARRTSSVQQTPSRSSVPCSSVHFPLPLGDDRTPPTGSPRGRRRSSRPTRNENPGPCGSQWNRSAPAPPPCSRRDEAHER